MRNEVDFILEQPLESSIPDNVSDLHLFRLEPSVMVITERNKGNPAFKEWSMRLSLGEKLPRGKYFRKEEWFRQFLHMPTGNTVCTTAHMTYTEVARDKQ